jgi:7-cyano-7-deazaguanine synthase
MITDMSEPRLRKRKALLLFSGGFDSTFVALTLQRSQCEIVPLVIDHPNRPAGEAATSERILDRLGITNVIRATLPLADFRHQPERWLSPRHEGWIPHRNLVFFGLAAHYAVLHRCDVIAAGTRVWDTTAYDDATEEFLRALESLLQNSGAGVPGRFPVELYFPIIGSHEPIKALLRELPSAEELLRLTWSCWRNEAEPCGRCAPCVTRAKFFAEVSA